MIKLTDLRTISEFNFNSDRGRLSGMDENGVVWIQFEVDVLAHLAECSICQRPLDHGWVCSDGGETVCASHIRGHVWQDGGRYRGLGR